MRDMTGILGVDWWYYYYTELLGALWIILGRQTGGSSNLCTASGVHKEELIYSAASIYMAHLLFSDTYSSAAILPRTST